VREKKIHNQKFTNATTLSDGPISATPITVKIS